MLRVSQLHSTRWGVGPSLTFPRLRAGPKVLAEVEAVLQGSCRDPSRGVLFPPLQVSAASATALSSLAGVKVTREQHILWLLPSSGGSRSLLSGALSWPTVGMAAVQRCPMGGGERDASLMGGWLSEEEWWPSVSSDKTALEQSVLAMGRWMGTEGCEQRLLLSFETNCFPSKFPNSPLS